MIASIGELLVEFICRDKDSRNLVPADYSGPYPSGAPGIFIDQVARIAGKALFVGAVGEDAFGRVIYDRLLASGVDMRLVDIIPDLPTGTAHVAYNSDGSRHFVFNIAASAAARLPHGHKIYAAFYVAEVRLLHVSGSALGSQSCRDEIMMLAAMAEDSEYRVSIDPNIRPELMKDSIYLQCVQQLITGATYVLPSDADADLLWPGQTFERWASPLIAAGARAVVLKRGDRGCIGMTATETLELPAHPVTVIDPTGAGDCFCATFVALMEAGHDFRFALTHANAAGALAVQSLGPMEGNCGLPAIQAFLKGQ